jgi:small subunit ribosomal protein S13
MARLVGVDLPREKRVEIALTYIFGVGRTRAAETLANTGVSPDIRVRDLGDDDLVKLREWIESNYRIEGDLRREVQADIRRKVEIGCYEGIRHRRWSPRPRAAHAHQRAHPQGPAQGHRRQEEGRQEVTSVSLRLSASRMIRSS